VSSKSFQGGRQGTCFDSRHRETEKRADPGIIGHNSCCGLASCGPIFKKTKCSQKHACREQQGSVTLPFPAANPLKKDLIGWIAR
jgi:hypothetical protein